MKKYIYLLTILLAGTFQMLGHTKVTFGSNEGATIYGIINYMRDAKGFWNVQRDFTANSLDGICYAIVPETNTVYVKTMTGNYRVLTNKDKIKQLKKTGAVKEYKSTDVESLVNEETAKLQATYNQLNTKRQATVTDSTMRVENALQAQRDAERREAEAYESKLRKGIADGSAFILPTGGLTFKCKYCSHEERNAKNLKIKAIANNYIYHLAEVDGPLGVKYDMIHVYPIRADLRTSSKFNQHLKDYGKAIVNDNKAMSVAEIDRFNKEQVAGLKDKIAAKAPDGYLDEVIIDCNGSQMSIEIYYVNSNPQKKTVSSIDFVMDYVTTSGSNHTAKFKLTGPVKYFDGTEYVNERAGYPCCSRINDITLYVTYTDGSKVTLNGDSLIFNE